MTETPRLATDAAEQITALTAERDALREELRALKKRHTEIRGEFSCEWEALEPGPSRRYCARIVEALDEAWKPLRHSP
jgi:hypothetical protein